MKLLIRTIVEKDGAGGRQRHLYQVNRPRCLVGRAHCDLILTDRRCSGQHAYIYERSDGKLAVKDLKSKNGTFVNGQRIHQETLLREGDVVVIGSTLLKITQFRPSTPHLEGAGTDSSVTVGGIVDTYEHGIVKLWPAQMECAPTPRKVPPPVPRRSRRV